MKKKVLNLIASVIGMSILAAGCGNAKETAVLQEDTVLEENENSIELNIAYMPNYGSLWSIVNAIEQEYLEEENIKVNLIEFADGPTIIAAMESGNIDLGYIGQGAHRFCINGQADVFALSHISNADMLIGGPGITSIEELEGKKVAYSSGTSSEDILVNSLKSVGMTMNDIIAIDLDKEGIVSAMISGGVEAAAVWSPYSLKILEEVENSVKLADNMTFSEETVSLSSWIVMPEYAKENRDVLVKFTRALFKAMDYAANENQEATASLVAEQISGKVEEVYEQRGDAQWLTGKEVAAGAADGSVEAYYESQKQTLIATGAVEANVDVEEYVMLDIMIEAGQYEGEE